MLATFPLWEIREDGTCGCGKACSSVGKHPKGRWADLASGENRVPESHTGGVGIATGSRSGLVVIDLDVRDGKDGIAAFAALGDVPDTLVVSTPSGGFHLYFQCPDFPVANSAGALGPGIDVRGEGGYVCAPDSPHRNGGTYEVFEDREPAPLPAWLSSLLRPAKTAVPASETSLTDEEIARRVALAEKYLNEAPIAVEGQNGSGALWAVATKLMCSYELPIDVAIDVIQPYNDRCLPPWSEKEILHKLTDASRADLPRGIAPEGWIERMRGVAFPKATYSYEIGKMTATKKAKIDMSTAVWHLLNVPAWKDVWRYNTLAEKIVAINPPMRLDAETKGITEADITAVRLWFETEADYAIGKDATWQAIERAAHEKRFHPIREYLAALPPSSGVLDEVATKGLGVAEDLPRRMIRKAIIGAVARMVDPGCQCDTSIVLCGPQGALKSSFVRELFSREYTKSQMPDLASKDASQALHGFWCVELGELEKVVRARDAIVVKEFLTRTFDDYRPPYEKKTQRFPRQCVFWGTTNEEAFLDDATGNRRFWPVDIGTIDLAWVKAHRDAIWSEAYAAYHAGESWWFDENLEEYREKFRVNDVWHDMIRDYCCGKQDVPGSMRLLKEVIGVSAENADNRLGGRVRKIMISLGAQERKQHGGPRYWEMPKEAQLWEPSEEEKRKRSKPSWRR